MMGRSPCCEKVGLKKGPWTPEEDQKLLACIEEHGHGSWRALPAKAGLQRCGKSCRLRWTNYLRPDIKRGKFSLQEEQTIIQLHALLGNRWSAIATHLPKRTDNEIKNYWNTHLKKRLSKMGIDPVTHKPKADALSSPDGAPSKSATNLSHMAQWESARLEAEARLARESKLRSQLGQLSQLGPSDSPKPSPSSPPPPCLDVLRAWQGAWAKEAKKGLLGAGDLESPTSTLSFSENVIPAPVASSIEEVNWRSFSRLKESVMEPTMMEFGHPWQAEGPPEAKNECFMDGITELLLENSDEQNSSDSDNNCGGDVSEESKSYWNSIFNMVNSSPSDSPLF